MIKGALARVGQVAATVAVAVAVLKAAVVLIREVAAAISTANVFNYKWKLLILATAV